VAVHRGCSCGAKRPVPALTARGAIEVVGLQAVGGSWVRPHTDRPMMVVANSNNERTGLPVISS
jgi:hypothetical protein